MVYNGFQWLHNEKKPGAGEKFGNPFFAPSKIFPTNFSFSSEDSPQKNLAITYEL